MRGGFREERGLLNKITGWESRTVPPLYMLRERPMVKTSHWGDPGRHGFFARSAKA